MQNDYICPGCGTQIGEFSIKKHIILCFKYDSFTLSKIKKLTDREDPSFIKFLQEQLSLAAQHLQRISKSKMAIVQKGSNFKQIKNPIQMVQQKYLNQPSKMFQDDDFIALDDRDMVICQLCKKKFYTSFDIDRLVYVEECWHLFCKPCIRKYVDNQFVNSFGCPKCPSKECKNSILEHQTKVMLGDKFQQMQNKAMRKMCNLVECIKCKSEYDFAPGNPNDAPKKDEHGKAVKPQNSILYSENRFLCPKSDCKAQQCKQCQASPYHLNMDCKQFKSRALMMKCRYCDTPITQKNIGKSKIQAHSDICNSKQCIQIASSACTKMLGCSHACSGIKNQKKCLPCLKEGCCEKHQELIGQTGDDYCAICYVESLGSSPSIQCGCGHIFHMKCLKKRFEIKWLTPRILFNFCVCPLCKKWIDIPPENQLYKATQANKALYAKIQKMSLDRLKHEELEKDEKITKKDSPYFNKPNQYAMAIYAYFQCFKCRNPYFGGRKNCAQAMNEQNVQGFKASQLVCPNCCEIPVENCPKHGTDFIQFKCKYCCSVAQWFCWGNTHFCQPCHKRQCAGDYVSKYTKDKLPACPGPSSCPTGGNHGGNGEQKMLGCAICRNYKQNNKGF